MAIPTDLSGLTLWLKADDMGTLVDNDPIATWPDRSGAARNFTATTTARPTYKTNILNGKPVVRFNGSSNVLSGPNFNTLADTSSGAIYTFVALVRVATAAASTGATYDDESIIAETAGNLSMAVRDSGGTLKFRAYNWVGSEHFASVDGSYGVWHIVAQDNDNTTLRIKLDGGSFSTFSTFITSLPSDARIGANYTNAAFFDGDIAELMVFNRVLGDTERASMEDYLDDKWISTGVTPTLLADMETGNLTQFSATSVAGTGALTATTARAYDGDYSALAEYNSTGVAANSFARGQWHFDGAAAYEPGDEIWYGAAFYLPQVAFFDAMQGEVSILRWDNFPTYGTPGPNDQSGIAINHLTDQAFFRLIKSDGTSPTVLIPEFVIPADEWFWIEIHQVFGTSDGGATFTEVFLDGVSQGSSTVANMFSATPLMERLRVGIVANNPSTQVNNLDVYFDRSTVHTVEVGPLNGGAGTTEWTTTITDDELVAAGAAEGTNLLKVFVRDAAGNWSS